MITHTVNSLQQRANLPQGPEYLGRGPSLFGEVLRLILARPSTATRQRVDIHPNRNRLARLCTHTHCPLRRPPERRMRRGHSMCSRSQSTTYAADASCQWWTLSWKCARLVRCDPLSVSSLPLPCKHYAPAGTGNDIISKIQSSDHPNLADVSTCGTWEINLSFSCCPRTSTLEVSRVNMRAKPGEIDAISSIFIASFTRSLPKQYGHNNLDNIHRVTSAEHVRECIEQATFNECSCHKHCVDLSFLHQLVACTLKTQC